MQVLKYLFLYCKRYVQENNYIVKYFYVNAIEENCFIVSLIAFKTVTMNKIISICIIWILGCYLSNAVAQTVVASVNPTSIKANAGDMITISIEIDMSASTELLGSFTGSINWNPTFLTYKSNSGVKGGFTGTINDMGAVASGQFFFNGANAAGVGGAVSVLEIEFEVGAGAAMIDLDFSAMAAALTFVDLLPVLEVKDSDIVVSIDDLNGDNGLMLLPPVNLSESGKVLFRFHLPKPGITNVKIYDVLGKTISVLADEPMANGNHQIKWDGTKHPTGMYLVQLQYEDNLLVQKFLLPNK